MTDDDENPFRDIKVGDRLWIQNAAEPSEFEVLLSDSLSSYPKNDKQETVFFVSAYSFNGTDQNAKYIIHSFPKSETPYDALLTFIPLEKDMSFEIPEPKVSFKVSNEAHITHLIFTNHKIQLQEQILIVFVCKQTDFDNTDRVLRGISDLIGFMSLLAGASIQGEELFSSYFCVDRKKFISGKLAVKERHPFESVIFNFKNIFERDEIDLQGDIVNAAIWFAGRAFLSNERNVKPVLFYTSLEIICGRSALNTIDQIYKGKEIASEANKCFRRIKAIRDKIIHSGVIEDIEPKLERMLQAIILDAIVFKIWGKNEKTALDALFQTEKRG